MRTLKQWFDDYVLHEGRDGRHDEAQASGHGQQDQDDEAVALDAHELRGQTAGQQAGQDLAAVQGWDGQQVEGAEYRVDEHPGHGDVDHGSQDVFRLGGGRRLGHDDQDLEQRGEEEHHGEIGHGPGQGDVEDAAPVVLVVGRVDGHGLGPADELGQEEDQGAHGVEVLQGIQGQPPGQLGRRVAHEVGDIAVRHLVAGYPEEKGQGDDGEIMEGLADVEHRLHRLSSSAPAGNSFSPSGNRGRGAARAVRGCGPKTGPPVARWIAGGGRSRGRAA